MSKILGVDVTSTGTSAVHELGVLAADPASPGNIYMYVQADDAITAYDAVTIDLAVGGSGTASNVPFVVTRSAAATDAIIGISQVAIAAGSFGWVLVRGTGIVQAETAVAAGDFLAASGVAGELITQPSTAVNPTKADFDSALASLHGGVHAVATEAEGATTAGFASCVVF